MSNKERYPDAWEFFIEQARNIEEEPEINHLGKYSIPVPDKSGNFIYANDVGNLWVQFIKAWEKPSLTSHSVKGKIQYIVQNF